MFASLLKLDLGQSSTGLITDVSKFLKISLFSPFTDWVKKSNI